MYLPVENAILMKTTITGTGCYEQEEPQQFSCAFGIDEVVTRCEGAE